MTGMAPHAPEVEILGSFFPAWMLCVTAAVVLVLPVRVALTKLGWDPAPREEIVVYPALWISLACLLWLALFA